MITYIQKIIYGRTTQNYSSEPHNKFFMLKFIDIFDK